MAAAGGHCRGPAYPHPCPVRNPAMLLNHRPLLDDVVTVNLVSMPDSGAQTPQPASEKPVEQAAPPEPQPAPEPEPVPKLEPSNRRLRCRCRNRWRLLSRLSPRRFL